MKLELKRLCKVGSNKKKTENENFPNVNLVLANCLLDNTYQMIFKMLLNFDVNSNL
jgi:hypothetical protein